MKYKNIKGMLHNLYHSFMASLHHLICADGRAIDELCNLLDRSEHDLISFDFHNGVSIPGTHSDEVMNLFRAYSDGYVDLLLAHRLKKEKLQYVMFTIRKGKSAYKFKVEALDDRGFSHEYSS
ncbi:hypothetical protein ONV78_29590 [Hahella sp. CR1]|uniref:hypothetical protein n=1 Tax=Hahella sp. CR1 TaxID=2992807 RepID=UPI002441C970|nr:hypothetical protein [Hahella sp. CR1]MDG9671923.1 hypothetical protein [Hahella sp. CR1]